MKAILSKPQPEGLKPLEKPRTPKNGDLNAICRQIRMLRSEIRKNKVDLSILKRDVGRIDRANYRAKSLSSKDMEKELNRFLQNFNTQNLPFGGVQ